MKKLFVFFIVFLLFFAVMSSSVIYAADTSEPQYTRPLEDLQKDESFSEDDYPLVVGDPSLKVIQIAEGKNGEVFVYVYQPGGGAVKATSINVSTTPHNGGFINYNNYALELIDTQDCIQKYKIVGLSVMSVNYRYYAVTAIYRKFNSFYDTNPGNGNYISEIAYNVSRYFCAEDYGLNVKYSSMDVNTLELSSEDVFIGFVRYSTNNMYYTGGIDRQFIAFSTDFSIDNIFEAEVYYVEQTYWKQSLFLSVMDWGFTAPNDKHVTLLSSDDYVYTGQRRHAHARRWNCIESVDDFVDGIERLDTIYCGLLINVSSGQRLGNEGAVALASKDWVLSYAETSFSEVDKRSSSIDPYYRYEQTFTGDVAILRLKYESEGKVYDVGVIQNKQTGNVIKPVNEKYTEISLKKEVVDWGSILLYVLGLTVGIFLIVCLTVFIIRRIVS